MAEFTEKAIMDSLKKLLNQYPLDKITVKQIVDDCGINRNTFYYHFKDIYDLLDRIFKEEAENTIQFHKSYDSWQDSMVDSMKFVIENKKAIYHIYNSINREILEPYLYNIVKSVMEDFVRTQAKGLNVSEEDIVLIAQFYKYALVGYSLEWIRNGMNDDAEFMIRYMGKIFDGNIKLSLEKIDSENRNK